MIYKNKWTVVSRRREIDGVGEIRDIARELNLTLPTAALLYDRGLRTPEAARIFLSKGEGVLHDPFLMKDMKEAAERIALAIERHEHVVIFGDYDVDGVTSTSILYLYLKNHGVEASYYIPSRDGEGYGLSTTALGKLKEEGAELVITVDTGITASKEAEYAREIGLEMIITDHHECHDKLPDAVAVVNPKRPDCTYPFTELAGVGVVFKLLCATETVISEDGDLLKATRRVSERYADLVAIGTVADVMPLCDENRLIVSYGLSAIENNTRPGLSALIDATRGDSKSSGKRNPTASFIGFTVAPRLNAAGRVRDAKIAVELLLEEDMSRAEQIAKTLCDINHERQEEENKIALDAQQKITEEHDFGRDPVVVLSDEEWHHGVIGIVASRITEKYGSPSILISFKGGDDPDMGKGSGRSVKGLNLVESLSYCSELLEKFGGHELAAGLSIRRENLPLFKEKINEYARRTMTDVTHEPVLEADLELYPDDITMRQAKELYYLEPYGVANPQPVFVMAGVTISSVIPVGAGKHTRLDVLIGSQIISAMCFRTTPEELDLFSGDVIDLMFTLDINEFRGNRTVQLIVKDVHLTRETAERLYNQKRAYELIEKGADRAEVLALVTAEDIVPTREDFAAVYSIVRKEASLGHEVFSIRALERLIGQRNIGYLKIKYILSAFRELSLLDVSKMRGEDVYVVRYTRQTEKKSLENSQILSKLKSDYCYG